MWTDQLCTWTGRRDVLRTTGALGVQAASTGVQRLECRPVEPASGFDPNLPAQSWRVVWNRFETRGDHAPEGRHLREAMILMPHGITQWTACEQQPKSTLHNQQPLLLQPLGPMTLVRNWSRRHLKRFPLRGVSQESSIAGLCDEFREPSQEIGPTVKLLEEPCDSWLSPFGTRSNSVSSRNGM